MATRDGNQKASGPKASTRKPASAKRTAPVESASVPRSASGAPRKPIQVIRDKPGSRSFWVFCDDGTVWMVRVKKNTLRWIEAGPPLPGSPEERRLGVATPLEASFDTL